MKQALRIEHLVDPDDLARAIDEKLVSVRTREGGSDLIYNYTDAALYTPGAWDNPAVRICRGLITSSSGGLVARPWEKFFNYGQIEAGALRMDAPVEVTDKLDGSLGIIHLDEQGGVRVATRGSFGSDQALHATRWVQEHLAPYWRTFDLHLYTPLVEIIYPENRIVCDYGDRDELVLLGAVETHTGRYLGPAEAAEVFEWPFAVTQTFEYTTLREALAAPPRPGAEGLCVRYLDENKIVKVKQEDYIRLHKAVFGLSERSVWEHLMAKGTLQSLLAGLPDELHPWARFTFKYLDRQAAYLYGQTLDTFLQMQHLTKDRAAFAAKAKQEGRMAPWLFAMLDGKPVIEQILKTLKPSGDTRARVRSEAVA